MRPPDLPGGNQENLAHVVFALERASMRPPDLPGGNWAWLTVSPNGVIALQ